MSKTTPIWERWPSITGARRARFNVAYIYLGGAGIGCGLILDGRLYRGEIGSAGEIGHLLVEEDGPACRCGAYGCLEAVAGMPALLSRSRAIGLPARQAADLIGLARAGQSQAAALIETAGEYLGVAVANILNMTNPGCVVIGGELAQAGDLLLGPLRRVMRRCGLAAAIEQVEIVPGPAGSRRRSDRRRLDRGATCL
ncbi:MAG TPA: ROK family protein [Roseiflexaceae bacterium]|nr:ROK family protein [Roseiflexaceae bacterium]